MTDLAPHLSAFLRQHLPRVCNASRHTAASYADSFMLLVRFAAGRLDIRPSEIAVEHLTPDLILDFLDHLEEQRRNSVGTRNVRLAAIKSFFRYLEYRVAACLDLARQVHAIPLKRRDEPMVNALDRDEVRALLNAPDPGTSTGTARSGHDPSRLCRRAARVRTDRGQNRQPGANRTSIRFEYSGRVDASVNCHFGRKPARSSGTGWRFDRKSATTSFFSTPEARQSAAMGSPIG